MKLTLTTPIEAHGEKLSELAFREPTGKDIRLCGVPIKIIAREDGGQENEFNAGAAAKYISTLAGIPPSSVDELNATDFMGALMIVAGFFNPPESTPAKPSTGTSS